MTNLEFNQAVKEGSNNVIFTDYDGKEYIHKIVKAGPKQVNLFNTFLKKEYKLSFSVHTKFPQYRIQ